MDCNEFSILLSGHIDGENTAEDELRLQRHLTSCGRCRALLADYEAIDAEIAALSAEPPEALAANVMARLRAPAKKRRFLFGGGTLAAAIIALAVVLPSLSHSRQDAGQTPAALSSPAGGTVQTPDEESRQALRTAGAQFVTAPEPLVIEITDDPDLPAAQNVAPLSQLPSALVDGNPEYYIDAAAAREIVDACGYYTVTIPDELSGAADDAPCLVRIVAAK